MLRGLFPRLFGQYREGGLIVGKFTVSNSGATLTPVSGDCYPKLTMATGTGTGQYVVTLAGGARKLTVVGQPHVSTIDEDDGVTDARLLFVNQEDGGVDAANGKVYLSAMNLAATQDEAALVDTSIVTIVLYADK